MKLIPTIMGAAAMSVWPLTGTAQGGAPERAVQQTSYIAYADALSQASGSGRDIVLFVDGSNWSAAAGRVREALASAGLRRSFGDKVIWARIDQPEMSVAEWDESQKPDNKAKANGRQEPNYTAWNIPALLLLDSSGKVFRAVEGVTTDSLARNLAELKGAMADIEKRDERWTQARGKTGREKATLLGEGLDCMPMNLATERKEIIEQIKAADPDDASGYLLKYTFDPSQFHEGVVMKLIQDKAYDKVFALVDKNLANSRLTMFQRQTMLAAKFQAYRAMEDLPNAIAILKKIVSLDPGTDEARGAASYIKTHAEPVRLTGMKWNTWDNRPIWTPMVLDVAAVVTQPGTYEVEFVNDEGHTRCRAVSLRQNGAVIASNDNAKESRKVSLSVSHVAEHKPVELWIETRGTGWFDGRGHIEIRKIR